MKKRVFVLLAALALLAAACLPALAAGDLDEISRFEVRVELRGDGTADITYTVDWLVLDSTRARWSGSRSALQTRKPMS